MASIRQRLLRPLRDRSIRVKTVFVATLASSVSLVLAGAGVIGFELWHLPTAHQKEMQSVTEIVAASAGASVASGDREATAELLSVLARTYPVERAEITDPAGNPLAWIGGSDTDPAPGRYSPGTFSLRHVDLEQPILRQGKRIGFVRVRVAMPDVGERLLLYAALLAGAFVAGLSCAVVVALQLQVLITRPIERLRRVLRDITREGDYRKRAEATTRDEIGALVESFNHAFAAIEERDAQLRASRDNLEEEVNRRTLELVHINAELNIEKDRTEKAAAAKSEFLASMSHELRTPMNAITGMTSLLLEADLNTEEREYLRTIRNASETLLRLVNDVLDFSKIEAGKLELDKLSFDLFRSVEEAIDLSVVRASEKGLNVFCHLSPSLPAAIRQDETRLRQILSNLLSNAVKFTEAGEVGVAASLRGEKDGLAEIEFCVSDTGIGIPTRSLGRLFRDFSQVDSSITRRYGGTGLGLAISQRLVRAMGGRIWVESEDGRGSRFHFTIRAEATAPPQPPAPLPAGSVRHLAVVDEYASNRRLLEEFTKAWGVRCSVVDPAREEPRELLRDIRYDALFLGTGRHLSELEAHTLWTDLRASTGREFGTIILQDRPLVHWEEHEGPRVHIRRPLRPGELRRALTDPEHREQDRHGRVLPLPDEQPVVPSTTRLLIVEDNRVNQRVLSLLLRQLGIEADHAANGQEALEAAARASYDIILMDIQMPLMDGVTATRRLRAGEGQGKPWIIALTANVQASDRESYLACGMNDFLGKPIRLEDLREVLLRAEPTDLARR